SANIQIAAKHPSRPNESVGRQERSFAAQGAGIQLEGVVNGDRRLDAQGAGVGDPNFAVALEDRALLQVVGDAEGHELQLGAGSHLKVAVIVAAAGDNQRAGENFYAAIVIEKAIGVKRCLKLAAVFAKGAVVVERMGGKAVVVAENKRRVILTFPERAV